MAVALINKILFVFTIKKEPPYQSLQNLVAISRKSYILIDQILLEITKSPDFFMVKYSIGHILGMVGLIDLKYWTNYITLPFVKGVG